MVSNFTGSIYKIICDSEGRKGMYHGQCLCERRVVVYIRLINMKNENLGDFCISIVEEIWKHIHSLIFTVTSFSINSSQGFGCSYKKISSDFLLGCFPRKRATHTSAASGWGLTLVRSWETKVSLCHFPFSLQLFGRPIDEGTKSFPDQGI